MNYGAENKKLSLIECKKALNINGLCYSDEEILKIRDWLYRVAEITIDALDKNANTTFENTETTSSIKNKDNP